MSLAFALPCRVCRAESGQRCVRPDGEPRSRSHHSRTPLSPCGSYGGYQRHVKASEEPCAECRDANRRYQAEHRNKHPERREADIAGLLARREATKRLIAQHRAEFKRLIDEVTREAAS